MRFYRLLLALMLVAAAAVAPVAVKADSALYHPNLLNAKAPATYRVQFKTTAGTFIVLVTRAWAPNGADRFYNLVKHGFFNNAEFFRVVPGFVVQFGLSGVPALDKIWANATFPDDKVTQSNHLGYVTFAAMQTPDSRTTQLFVNLAENKRLDQMGFAPIGRVTSGMDVVQKLYSGYGQTPDQGQIASDGNTYLRQQFPQMDVITSAKLLPK